MNWVFFLFGGEIILINFVYGLIMDDSGKKEWFFVIERNGLCSNVVLGIVVDGCGNFWGVMDNGVFYVFIFFLFSCYIFGEGLKGEVILVVFYKGMIYIGIL